MLPPDPEIGRNILDLMTTVLGGKFALVAVISSPPLTGETRTMRMPPPRPGTLTSFTGTILAPGRMGRGLARQPAALAANVVTVIEDDMDVVVVTCWRLRINEAAGGATATNLLVKGSEVLSKIVLAMADVSAALLVKLTPDGVLSTSTSLSGGDSWSRACDCLASISRRSGDTLSSAPSQDRIKS